MLRISRNTWLKSQAGTMGILGSGVSAGMTNGRRSRDLPPHCHLVKPLTLTVTPHHGDVARADDDHVWAFFKWWILTTPFFIVGVSLLVIALTTNENWLVVPALIPGVGMVYCGIRMAAEIVPGFRQLWERRGTGNLFKS